VNYTAVNSTGQTKVASLMRNVAMFVASLLAVSLLSGCGKHAVTCKQSNKDYVGAQEVPPLKAPPGLEAPNTRNALKVPPLNTPERMRGRDEPCLDAPPPYTTTPKATPAPPPATDAPKPQ
jgi:uncharacterized lipoprotein